MTEKQIAKKEKRLQEINCILKEKDWKKINSDSLVTERSEIRFDLIKNLTLFMTLIEGANDGNSVFKNLLTTYLKFGI